MVDACVGEKGLLARIRAGDEYRKQFATVETLKNDNARLRDKAASLRDDPAASEAIAREELGLIREGEVLFIVRDAK
ncbi:MAG: septum formation initiator family protein, partial [Acidobacteria bacterium]|nr:septum formation initiator family protein [Acidobacteriota bacterium]